MKYKDYFKTIPILETDRCILRLFKREDRNAYFEIWRDEKCVIQRIQ